jgi:hypothetical protein
LFSACLVLVAIASYATTRVVDLGLGLNDSLFRDWGKGRLAASLDGIECN